MPVWLSIILGCALIGVLLLDVFLTVLYARMDAGRLGHIIERLAWRIFRLLARLLPSRRDAILGFAGPVIIVTLIATWFVGLMIAGALVVHPTLGSGVVAHQAPTPTDFFTALYLVGDAMTTVGASDLSPKTPALRMFFTFMSAVGLGTLTLTITYLLQIYNALHRRNTYVVKLHHATGGSGDAVELLAGLGATGDFHHGYAHLADMAAEVAEIHEAHHFYAVLLYFRFAEPHYALPRGALVTLDTITLINAALDDEKHAWLKESTAVAQLWRAAMRVLTELSIVFLPDGIPESEPDAPTTERWQQRYLAAVARLRQAGIQTMSDEDVGIQNYIAQRARWDRYIRAFADHMIHPMDQVDPATTDPAKITARPDFANRLRAAG